MRPVKELGDDQRNIGARIPTSAVGIKSNYAIELKGVETPDYASRPVEKLSGSVSSPQAQTKRVNEGALLVDKLPAHGLSVGAVAALLGIAPGTLRSWGRRYGLVPAGRSVGGHRRYTESETLTLIRMQTLVNAGEAPATAASMVRSTQNLLRLGIGAEVAVAQVYAAFERGHTIGRRPDTRLTAGASGGRTLAVSGATTQVRDLARAAAELDIGVAGSIVEHQLLSTGALPTWDDLLRPVLVAAASASARSGGGTDIEHVLNEAIMDALRVHRARQLRPRASGPVLLAGSVEEMHVLPLYVLGAALAERRAPAVLLGARVPSSALAAAARRTGASAVFLWRARECTDEIDLRQFREIRPRIRVVVGGPGWLDVDLPTDAHRASSLQKAVSMLQTSAGVEKTCASGRGSEIGLQRTARAAVPICTPSTLECGD